MVDNFGRIRPLLRFDNEGDCYYVQLLRRAADDPKPNGSPDPKYHGNMHSRSIKDYFIRSLDHLNDVEDEIKQLCTMFNVLVADLVKLFDCDSYLMYNVLH